MGEHGELDDIDEALAVKTGFLWFEQDGLLDDNEGGGEVRVVVSGPWVCGDIDMCRPLVMGDVRLKLPDTPGMLNTGGKGPSLTSDERGTLTVLTIGAPGKSVPG